MTQDGDGALEVVPVRHVGQWIAAACAAVLIAMLVHTLFSKLGDHQYSCQLVHGVRRCHEGREWRFTWDIVGHYFTSKEILNGLVLTIWLTFAAMAIGIVLGVGIAVLRRSPNRLLSSSAWTYTWFFRGTPVYVQLFVWFYMAILYKHLSIGVPFTHLTLVTFNMSTLITADIAALLGLGLNEAAYMSEITRAGLLSVDEGQIEAASALGMTRRQTMRLIMLPQAMRVIIPPTGSEIISMLKTTSLVSAIGAIDLLGAASNIYGQNYEIMPLLITASLWYLIVTTIFSIGQFYVERHFAKGALRSPPPTPLQRLRADVAGVWAKTRRHQSVPRLTR